MMLLLIAPVAQATVRTVTNAVDETLSNGLTSLREALALSGSGDDVVFSATVFPAGSFTTIAVVLGSLTVPVGVDVLSNGQASLDGAGSPGASGLLLAGKNRVLGLAVHGFDAVGVRVSHGVAGSATVGGLGAGEANYVYDNGQDGIKVQAVTATGLVVIGNKIGVSPAGAVAGNCLQPASSVACAGIRVLSTTTAAILIEGNVIVDTQGDPAASQGMGILVGGSDGIEIVDNLVGVTASGSPAGNTGRGIQVAGSGIVATITGNTLSANDSAGLLLGPGSDGSIVQDNVIGAAPGGLTSVSGGNQTNGIRVFASDDHQILDNVISGNSSSGINLAGSFGGNWHSGSIIQGNLIGVDATGWVAIPNGRHGITSSGNEGNCTIGGPNTGDRNVISGNGWHGIELLDHMHTVQGNYVGTTRDGSSALPNGTDASGGPWAGIYVGGKYDLIGGSDPETEGNVVSGNLGYGIEIAPGSEDAAVMSNLVGVEAPGRASPGLGQGETGIAVRGYSPLVTGNTVCGSGKAVGPVCERRA